MLTRGPGPRLRAWDWGLQRPAERSALGAAEPLTRQMMLVWDSRPQTCLLLLRPGGDTLEAGAAAARHLDKLGVRVLVEPGVLPLLQELPGLGFLQCFSPAEQRSLRRRVDFVACLGGDGVILHASHLFREGPIPPILSFNLGSLGFLTSHEFSDFRADVDRVVEHSWGGSAVRGVHVTLRMRLRCVICRGGRPLPDGVHDVLNEVVVDRGPAPFLSMIECYERDRLITKVQGDGVMVATPTGSTAYSAAAGGPICHPSVPAMLFTPICPHTLSFRPVVLPDSSEIELRVPEDARSTAWVCFDGQRRQRLERGDSLKVSMSPHPMPTINKNDQTDDWFLSLGRCLSWNERIEQRPLSAEWHRSTGDFPDG